MLLRVWSWGIVNHLRIRAQDLIETYFANFLVCPSFPFGQSSLTLSSLPHFIIKLTYINSSIWFVSLMRIFIYTQTWDASLKTCILAQNATRINGVDIPITLEKLQINKRQINRFTIGLITTHTTITKISHCDLPLLSSTLKLLRGRFLLAANHPPPRKWDRNNYQLFK